MSKYVEIRKSNGTHVSDWFRITPNEGDKNADETAKYFESKPWVVDVRVTSNPGT